MPEISTAITATQLKKVGYYWHLPSFLKHAPEKPENWSIIQWHPKDYAAVKSGFFWGPLSPPCKIS